MAIKRKDPNKAITTPTQITPMADSVIAVNEMHSVRAMLYANDNKETGIPDYVIEIDVTFSGPQADWKDQNTIKLRNKLSQLKNIKYKHPEWHFVDNWYENAYEEADEFEYSNKAGFAGHCKLGTRMTNPNSKKQTAYYNVVCTLVSVVFENGVPVIQLQISQPCIESNDTVSFVNYATCFELNNNKYDKDIKAHLYWAEYAVDAAEDITVG